MPTNTKITYTLPLSRVTMADLPDVGGKNASLGEMISHLSALGIKVPGGFATTADAFREFLSYEGLDQKINTALNTLNVDDVPALAAAGARMRDAILSAPLPPSLEAAIRDDYHRLQGDAKMPPAVAVRSSATAEDLPDASFAGQQETYLNITGIENVLTATKQVFASLFNDRAIAYRVHQGFAHADVALSVGVQRMVRSDMGASGVMFSVDTESGFDQVVFITAAYGLGETVVQGEVNPDEFYVHKPMLALNKPAIVRRRLGSKALKMVYNNDGGSPVKTIPVDQALQRQYCLSNDDILTLARFAVIIEQHYKKPMDIEWGKDGETGEIMILQARPETVTSRSNAQVIETYRFKETCPTPLLTGRSIGQKIGQGPARVIQSITQMDEVQPGDVLVTDMTDPDWEPIMKRASAIVTNRGGRTCHAAIIAREMGIPAIVGCNTATNTIENNAAITVSCAEGDTGLIYPGLIPFEKETVNVASMPEIPFKIMMNVANPDHAFKFANLPHNGIGLARLEFIINTMIGYHPKALLHPELIDKALQQQIEEDTAGYDSPKDFYIEKLTEGIATLAAAFYPEPVIVRLSDFKSNEYANLAGGEQFEPHEENPMLGFRGASRYISNDFQACFALECEAVLRVRNLMGLTNVEVMIPFVRTVDEAKAVSALLAEHGLARGDHGLRHIMMCEIPSNALLADQFLEYFDGFSIGSNDMTQLTLGLDRDSALVADCFDERNDAVKAMLSLAIKACKAQNKYIGICGQGPSDHPDLAEWLVEQGIDSISLNPDTVVETWLYLASQR